jgi:hypothetical protein
VRLIIWAWSFGQISIRNNGAVVGGANGVVTGDGKKAEPEVMRETYWLEGNLD